MRVRYGIDWCDQPTRERGACASQRDSGWHAGEESLRLSVLARQLYGRSRKPFRCHVGGIGLATSAKHHRLTARTAQPEARAGLVQMLRGGVRPSALRRPLRLARIASPVLGGVRIHVASLWQPKTVPRAPARPAARWSTDSARTGWRDERIGARRFDTRPVRAPAQHPPKTSLPVQRPVPCPSSVVALSNSVPLHSSWHQNM